MRKLHFLVLLAVMAIGSPASGQHHADAEAAIRAGSQKWAAAWNAGDAAALAALHATDATVTAPGSEPVVGRAAIEKYYTAALEASAGMQNSTETLEVIASDGWAVELGKFVANAADGTHLDHGRYTSVWKNVDGKWMLYSDMWNSSMSP